jgi:hypothetical protein
VARGNSSTSGCAFQLGDDAGDPFHGRLAVEAFAGVEQAAAELFLLVGQDHQAPLRAAASAAARPAGPAPTISTSQCWFM